MDRRDFGTIVATGTIGITGCLDGALDVLDSGDREVEEEGEDTERTETNEPDEPRDLVVSNDQQERRTFDVQITFLDQETVVLDDAITVDGGEETTVPGVFPELGDYEIEASVDDAESIEELSIDESVQHVNLALFEDGEIWVGELVHNRLGYRRRGSDR